MSTWALIQKDNLGDITSTEYDKKPSISELDKITYHTKSSCEIFSGLCVEIFNTSLWLEEYEEKS